MYLELWMQISIVIVFGCCAIMSYRKGEAKGRLDGSLETINFLRGENIILVDSNGMITPAPTVVPPKPRKRKKQLP